MIHEVGYSEDLDMPSSNMRGSTVLHLHCMHSVEIVSPLTLINNVLCVIFWRSYFYSPHLRWTFSMV